MNPAGPAHFRLRPLKMQLLAIMGLFISSCGMIHNQGASTSCGTGTAIIQVYDGSLKRICGCTESGNVTFSPGQSLTCSVPVGTRLYIDFVGIQNTHQIAVNTIGSTPPRGASSTSVQTDVLYLNSTGTFSFQDFYYPSLGGSLVVF